jgi:hypothetical protein
MEVETDREREGERERGRERENDRERSGEPSSLHTRFFHPPAHFHPLTPTHMPTGPIDTPATSLHAKKLGITKADLVADVSKELFLKKLGSTLDVAYAALYLASNESSFVTGTSLLVDGGYTAH